MIVDPLCPHCNTELEYDGSYDMEYDEDSIVLYQSGHCPKCRKDYQWQSSAHCTQWTTAELEEC